MGYVCVCVCVCVCVVVVFNSKHPIKTPWHISFVGWGEKAVVNGRFCDTKDHSSNHTAGNGVHLKTGSGLAPQEHDPISLQEPASHTTRGAGIAQWLECRIRDWKVAGSNPCRSGGRIFFSRVVQGRPSVLTLISVSVPPLCYCSST